jgi:hypothetical protein
MYDAPLSLKQKREDDKLRAQLERENVKLANEESRKDDLHQVKMSGALSGASQKLDHKEDTHRAKMQELKAPLGAPKMAAKGTDTVPAMLTRGEAVIPREAAQDPANKPVIAAMVNGGKPEYYAGGTTYAGEDEDYKPMPGYAREVQLRDRVNEPNPVPQVLTAKRQAEDSAGIRELLKTETNSDTRRLLMEALNPVPPETIKAERIAGDQAAFDRELANPNVSAASKAILMGSEPYVAGQPVTSQVPVPANKMKSLGYDTQVVSPNWLGKENKESPNAAMRASGAFPVTTPAGVKGIAVPNARGVPEYPSQTPAAVPPVAYSSAKDSQAVEPASTKGSEPDFNQEAFNNLGIASSERAEIIGGFVKTANEMGGSGQEKQGWLANALSGLFGDTGLFNARELTRFGIVAAGGMLTGGSTGGSLRYAGKDALNQSDARMANQQAEAVAEKKEWTAREKSLLEAGYRPEGVKAFRKSGDSKDLGDPVERFETTGDRKAFTFTEGANRGKTFTAEKRVVKTGKRKGSTDYYYNGQLVPTSMMPLDEFKAQESESLKNYASFGKDAESIVKDFNTVKFPNKKGEVNAALQGQPTASEISTEMTGWMRARGFNPDNPQMYESMKGSLNRALNSMANTPGEVGTTKSISAHLDKALVMYETGINSTDFMLATNKSMPPSMMSQLYHKAEQVANKKEPKNATERQQYATDALTKVRKEFADFKKQNPNRVIDSKTQTAFFSYAMDNLK